MKSMNNALCNNINLVNQSTNDYMDLDAKRIIGSGSFGYVFEAVDRKTKKTVAVKRTSKSGEYVSREFEVLEKLKSCKNVVQLLNIYYSKNEEGKLAQNLVFEFCKTNLEEVIQKSKEDKQFLPMQDIRNFMFQILTGMAFVHSQGICHRDLKPENILMNEQCVVKICDFGSAKVLRDSNNTPYIVSRYYRAPELILAVSDYTNKIDIWAIGCIFAEFITLRPLFPGKTEGSQLIEQVAILGLPSKDQLAAMSEKKMDQNTIELVHKLDDIPKKDFRKILPRGAYSADDIEQASDLLEKMLDWNPKKRISCADALSHPFFDKR